jgi:hypothetical protein
MSNIAKHLSILGTHVKDRITGIEGVATSVCFDLYGCIQVILHPGVDKDGKPREQCWFDIARLEILDRPRAMPVPDFQHGPIAEGKKGPAEKPTTPSRVVQGMIALGCMALLGGCGGISRKDYEQANPKLPVITEFQIKDGPDAGATRVVYGPDRDPRIDFTTGDYTCPEGVRVNTYRDGVLVARWFQPSEALRPAQSTH